MAALASKEQGIPEQSRSDEEILTVSVVPNDNEAVQQPQPAVESGIKCSESKCHGCCCRQETESTVEILDIEESQKTLGADCTLQPYDEITRLLWIKNNTACSTALAEWNRKTELFTARVDRRDKYIADFRNEIYQLVGFFSAFQGLVLTAVTQLTQSADKNHCGKVWSPVVLSGLAWVVAVVGVWQKFDSIELIEAGNRSEKFSRTVVQGRELRLRNLGKDFDFRTITERKFQPKAAYTSWVSRGIVVLTLSLFTGVFIASYFLILCDTGQARKLDKSQ